MPPKKAEAIKVVKGKKKSIDLKPTDKPKKKPAKKPPPRKSRMNLFEMVYSDLEENDGDFNRAQQYVMNYITRIENDVPKVRPYRGRDEFGPRFKFALVKKIFKTFYQQVDDKNAFAKFKIPRTLTNYFGSFFTSRVMKKNLDPFLKKFHKTIVKEFTKKFPKIDKAIEKESRERSRREEEQHIRDAIALAPPLPRR